MSRIFMSRFFLTCIFMPRSMVPHFHVSYFHDLHFWWCRIFISRIFSCPYIRPVRTSLPITNIEHYCLHRGTLNRKLMNAGRHGARNSKWFHTKICRHFDLSEMRIFVLRQHLQSEPKRVLRLWASWLALLSSVRHTSRLECSFRHHQLCERQCQVRNVLLHPTRLI